jgi:hypothetical protein
MPTRNLLPTFRGEKKLVSTVHKSKAPRTATVMQPDTHVADNGHNLLNFSYRILQLKKYHNMINRGPEWLSKYNYWLRAGRSRDRIPVEAKFFAHVQTGPWTHPASCTMGTGYFPGVKRPGCGADHPHLLAPKSRKIRATPLNPPPPPLGPSGQLRGTFYMIDSTRFMYLFCSKRADILLQ